MAAEAFGEARGSLLSELQERFFAEGKLGGHRTVLVVVQGLDTAGKGGIVRHVMGMVDPQGIQLRSFGVPTEEERRHHYLWRVRRALPVPGKIGVFDRSHYEEVLIARVNGLVEPDVWQRRYAEINRFEKGLVDNGLTLIKVALMVSYEEQGLRLMERLNRPDKRWKFNPGDIDTRGKWDAYQGAYADVFRLTSTAEAPWYVVPADRKWYARLAVTELLTQTLVDLDPTWPQPDWQVEEQKRALAATMSAESVAAAEEAAAQNLADAAADDRAVAAAVDEARNIEDDPSARGDGDAAPLKGEPKASGKKRKDKKKGKKGEKRKDPKKAGKGKKK